MLKGNYKYDNWRTCNRWRISRSSNANKEFMTEAHRAQTNIIQGEASGEKRAHSLLFAHAQDTLMTIFSELNITMSLVGIVKSIEYKVNNSKWFK